MRLYDCFYVFIVINSRPELKDLLNLITPNYAAHWKDIGTQLGITSGMLNGIETSYRSDAFLCCDKLLEKWHDQDVHASWKKIIDSVAVAGLKADPQQNISGQELIT